MERRWPFVVADRHWLIYFSFVQVLVPLGLHESKQPTVMLCNTKPAAISTQTQEIRVAHHRVATRILCFFHVVYEGAQSPVDGIVFSNCLLRSAPPYKVPLPRKDSLRAVQITTPPAFFGRRVRTENPHHVAPCNGLLRLGRLLLVASMAGGVQPAAAQTVLGNVSTLAGSGGVTGFSNGLGTAAKFNLPFGVTMDAAGTVALVVSGAGEHVGHEGELSPPAHYSQVKGGLDTQGMGRPG